MAVGESVWPEIYSIDGVSMGIAQAGVKYSGRDDLLVFRLCEGASVAGVYTQNAFCAAPVKLCRQHMASGHIRALIINSGNANACTGPQGRLDAQSSCGAVAQALGFTAEQVLPFSTGVIGEPLPVARIHAAIPAAVDNLSVDNWSRAARAIMTTDTRPKGVSRQIQWQGETISITGIAKGAGMIRPNMATMLAYVATDAAIAQPLLQQMLKIAADASFNRITIDGDTSTNDSCILIASGKSVVLESEQNALYDTLLDAFIDVYQNLAKAIVLDGEGATKCVQIDVLGARSASEALDVGYAIAHSPLVKTALFACDPNWGRIVCAIGYAGVIDLDDRLVKVWLDDVLIVENGGRAASYSEELGQQVFDREAFTIKVDLGRGDISERLWTSDLSHEYVRINAEYRS